MAKKEAVKDAAPAQAVGRPLAPAAKPPGPGEAAHWLTAQILALEPLREPAGSSGSPGGLWQQFVRHSCCLLYPVPGAGTCGDRVLTAGQWR